MGTAIRFREAGATRVKDVDRLTVSSDTRLALFRDGANLDESIETLELLSAFGVQLPIPLHYEVTAIDIGAVVGGEQDIALPVSFPADIPVLMVRNGVAGITGDMFSISGPTLTWKVADDLPFYEGDFISLYPFAAPLTAVVEAPVVAAPMADLITASSITLTSATTKRGFNCQIQPGGDTVVTLDNIPYANIKATGSYDHDLVIEQLINGAILLRLKSGQSARIMRLDSGHYDTFE